MRGLTAELFKAFPELFEGRGEDTPKLQLMAPCEQLCVYAEKC